jgi:hypothetical protein
MTKDQILDHLTKNPTTHCWISFGTYQIRLGKGEGLILLRCMDAGEPGFGPTQVCLDSDKVIFHYEGEK